MADPKAPNKAPAAAKVAMPEPAKPTPPTKTGAVTYAPGPGDPPVTVAFGKTFRAGKATEVDDAGIYQKLAGHPRFGRQAKQDDGDDEELRKVTDQATEEARKAREEADAVGTDAEAKERAAKALTELQSAANDPDRDPVTNHPVNR